MVYSRLSQWLAVYHCLTSHKHFSLSHFNLLLKNIGCPAVILDTDTCVYEKAGMSKGFCDAIHTYQQGRSFVHKKVEADLEWMQEAGNHILTCGSSNYPVLLKAIPDPPPLLYLQGNPDAINMKTMAMVGSRKPSPSGRRLARRFARELSSFGIAVGSGLAYGIDSESHRGALEVQGTTIAVLGGGLNRLYPKAHQSLAAEIVKSGGCMVSEFPLDFQPRAWCFPMRNRLITGLSRGVLVVEATLKSGSLISAKFALEQGREVYAIPGHIDSPQSRGCHHLIREGACLVESVGDILADWVDVPAPDYGQGQPGKARQNEPDRCSDQEQQVLDALGAEGQSVDALAQLTGKDASTLSVTLGELEVRGLVSRLGSTYCIRR